MNFVPNLDSDIHVWEIDTNEDNYLSCKNFTHVLSIQEKYKANKFRFIQDYERFIITYIALRMLISYYIKIRPEEIVIHRSKYGKPYIQEINKSNINFNLSHSNKKIIISFYIFDIGVDIEYIRTLTDIESISKFIFSEQEQLILTRYVDDAKIYKFFEIWTKKEALLKAIGIGLNDYARNVYTNAYNNIYILNNLPKSNMNFNIVEIHLTNKNYIANLAYANIINPKIKYYIWDKFYLE